MIILDNSNGGFNGVTKDFWTTDLRAGEVVRRYFKALQGGYVIDDSKNSGGGGGGDTPGENMIIFENTADVKQRAFLFTYVGRYYNEDTVPYTFECGAYEDHRYLKSFNHIRVIEKFNLKIDDKNISISLRSASNVFSALFISNSEKQALFNNLESKFIEIYKEPSTFFIKNTDGLSEHEILNKFQFNKKKQKALSLWENTNIILDNDGETALLKPYLFISLENNNTLNIFFYVLELSFGKLTEYRENIKFNNDCQIDAFCATRPNTAIVTTGYCGIGIVKKDLDKKVVYNFETNGNFKNQNGALRFYTISSNEAYFDHYYQELPGIDLKTWIELPYLSGVGAADNSDSIRAGIEYNSNVLGLLTKPEICAYKNYKFEGYEDAGIIN